MIHVTSSRGLSALRHCYMICLQLRCHTRSLLPKSPPRKCVPKRCSITLDLWQGLLADHWINFILNDLFNRLFSDTYCL